MGSSPRRREAPEEKAEEAPIDPYRQAITLEDTAVLRGSGRGRGAHRLIRIRGILSPKGPVPLSVGSIERYRDTPKTTN